MRRREFIAGLLAASLASAKARERSRITILHSGFPNRTPIHLLFQEFGKLGYENGLTASIELLGGEGNPDRLKALVSHIASQTPDIIIALTSPAILALKQAGLTTPIVFAFVSDPIKLGLVESLARPGANFTGVTYSEAALGGKRLELLIDALPGIKRLAVLWSTSFPENAAIFENVRGSATAQGIEVSSRQLRGVEDLAPAFDDATKAAAQAIIFMTDNELFGHRKEVAELALAHQLPSIHSFLPEVRDGGLMSYGPSLGESYQRVAVLADRILKGARPADLPVEEPTRFELAINLKTAKALGLTIPPSIMVRADEVIE
jgi:putative tryptophan/tyrosine transport system substrate-binding protein